MSEQRYRLRKLMSILRTLRSKANKDDVGLRSAASKYMAVYGTGKLTGRLTALSLRSRLAKFKVTRVTNLPPKRLKKLNPSYSDDDAPQPPKKMKPKAQVLAILPKVPKVPKVKTKPPARIATDKGEKFLVPFYDHDQKTLLKINPRMKFSELGKVQFRYVSGKRPSQLCTGCGLSNDLDEKQCVRCKLSLIEVVELDDKSSHLSLDSKDYELFAGDEKRSHQMPEEKSRLVTAGEMEKHAAAKCRDDVDINTVDDLDPY
jgi:hypothetical protein